MFVPKKSIIFPDFAKQRFLLNLLRRPHGRKMLCAMFHLGIEGKSLCKAGALVEAAGDLEPVSREDAYKLLSGPTAPPEALAALFNREILPAGYITCGSDAAKALQRVAKSKIWCLTWGGTRLVDLASPAVSGDVIRQFYMSAATTTLAKVALSANLNCPIELQQKPKPEMERYFIDALAAYGDLNHAATFDILTTLIKGGAPGLADESAMSLMCRRKTLTSHFAETLDKAVPDEYDYQHLSRNSAHQDYIAGLQNDSTGMDCFVVDRGGQQSLKFSPALTCATLTRLYDDVESGNICLEFKNKTMALLAAMPNASRTLVERALDDDEVRCELPFALITNDSPHAEYAVMSERGIPVRSSVMAAFSHTTANGLAFAYNDNLGDASTIFTIVSHPQFPWGQFPLSRVLNDIPDIEQFHASVYCAAHLSGKCSPQELAQTPDKYACSLLFNPSLSGRRVEKISVGFPELAGLAAIHPNGGDTPFAAGTTVDILAKRLKSNPVSLLSGRGMPAGNERGEQIVL